MTASRTEHQTASGNVPHARLRRLSPRPELLALAVLLFLAAADRLRSRPGCSSSSPPCLRFLRLRPVQFLLLGCLHFTSPPSCYRHRPGSDSLAGRPTPSPPSLWGRGRAASRGFHRCLRRWPPGVEVAAARADSSLEIMLLLLQEMVTLLVFSTITRNATESTTGLTTAASAGATCRLECHRLCRDLCQMKSGLLDSIIGNSFGSIRLQ